MKILDEFIQKLDFKKAITLYIFFAFIAGVISVCFLGYQFREKLTLVYEYKQFSEKYEDNKIATADLNSQLTKFAGKFVDIVDILVLDNNNNIIFSAKKSEFSKAEKLVLDKASNDRSKIYLYNKQNPNIYFSLDKNDVPFLSKQMFSDDKDIRENYDDERFYENDFAGKKIFNLSYSTDKKNGNKIYFISDIKPVPNGELYLKIVMIAIMLFFTIYWILVTFWVYQNAAKAKLNQLLWGIITLFTNLAGLFVYLIYKGSNTVCFKCDALQSKGNVYCTFCGSKIGEVCENCNTTVNENDGFCKNCGQNLTKDKE